MQQKRHPKPVPVPGPTVPQTTDRPSHDPEGCAGSPPDAPPARRGSPDPAAPTTEGLAPPSPASRRAGDKAPPPLTRQQSANLEKLLKRAAAGDPSVVPLIRTLLDSDAGPTLLAQFGDVSALAHDSWIGVCAHNNLLIDEAIRRRLAALRNELCPAGASPLERLLTDRVLTCWLQLFHADAWTAQTDKVQFTEGDFAQRLLSKAQHRYLSAIKSLVTIRKLLRPPLSPMDLASRPVAETPLTADARLRGAVRSGGLVGN